MSGNISLANVAENGVVSTWRTCENHDVDGSVVVRLHDVA
jgi:hypothetical protein